MRSKLVLVLLLIACFSLSTLIARKGEVSRSGPAAESFVALLLGEGRMLFANEIFAKADVYFHRGNYPSIFEGGGRPKENHMAGEAQGEGVVHEAHGGHEHHEGDGHEHHDHAGEPHADAIEHAATEPESPAAGPSDWISRFRQKFHAADHVHLEKGAEREMLPWLKLSAELNPQSIESFTVAAYWLRSRLNKVDEAEQFLREGLRRNPGNPELLNELAWLKLENRRDPAQARNLWHAAMQRWFDTETGKEEPNNFLAERILGGMFKTALEEKRLDEAIHYLNLMKRFSPNPENIQKRIEQLQTQPADQ
ncbi:MAG TPA: hypothetical protein VEH04_01310 [Verrucomicrobiae bacterium]|nr:hypothetical protein [Verrucomicrobiae bacterium]